MKAVQNRRCQRRQTQEKNARKNDPVQVDRQVPVDMVAAENREERR